MKKKLYFTKTIQGLLSSETADSSFWLLKAKVELSTYQNQRREVTKH